jgi:hypothetical protein
MSAEAPHLAVQDFDTGVGWPLGPVLMEEWGKGARGGTASARALRAGSMASGFA